MSSPAAFTSCLGPNGKSLVFYVDKHGILKTWIQKNPTEKMNAEGRNAYDDKETTTSDGKIIKTASKDLAATWLERMVSGRATLQFRLYFSNEDQVMSELCMDVDKQTLQPIGNSAGGFWYDGGLTKQGYKTQKDTAISAHYNSKDGSLKVYFFKLDARAGDRPTIAWIPIVDGQGWKILDDGGSL